MSNLRTRNYGIDLLRIIAMVAVVSLHVLVFGGILNAAVPFSAQYELAWLLETVCYCSVDVYVLITGYVYAGKSASGRRLLVLWLTVLFYSVLIPLVLYAFGYPISKVTLINSFMPIMRKRYWFFNAYFALFLFIPMCNIIAQNKTMLIKALLISFVLFSVASTLSVDIDLFLTNGGSSFLWFLNLYLCGAYIRLYGLPKEFSIRSAAILFFICILTMLGVNNLCLMISDRMLGKPIRWLLYSYSSPLFYIAAICIVAVFSRIEIRTAGMKKIIEVISPLTFGVYLIHENPEFRQFFMKDAFISYLEKPVLVMFCLILSKVICIFVGCCFVDYLRGKIFALLKINTKATRLIDRITIRYQEKCKSPGFLQSKEK